MDHNNVAGLEADICLSVRNTCQRRTDSLLGTIRNCAVAHVIFFHRVVCLVSLFLSLDTALGHV